MLNHFINLRLIKYEGFPFITKMNKSEIFSIEPVFPNRIKRIRAAFGGVSHLIVSSFRKV